MERRQFTASLMAGGCAGMSVDLILYPLDTIKTRLQSQQGFFRAGGFKKIYAGVPTAAIGSFPNAAAFFVTYESTKSLLGSAGLLAAPHLAPVTHMLAASLGEVVACLIRVPTEVVKQRTQASPGSTTYHMLLATLRQEGIKGLYRGYGSTVLREIPFSLVQFPLWEYLKSKALSLWAIWTRLLAENWTTAGIWSSFLSCSGFLQVLPPKTCTIVQGECDWDANRLKATIRRGAAAALITTPLDVAKTRIMLAKPGTTAANGNIPLVLGEVWRTRGLSGLFAGAVPRVTLISTGGFIFLGAYEHVRSSLL